MTLAPGILARGPWAPEEIEVTWSDEPFPLSPEVTDIVSVANQVASLSFVRPGAVGYLAVCASAQYALAALAQGTPIASYASVAGWFHDTASVAPFYGGMDGVNLRLERARSALASNPP